MLERRENERGYEEPYIRYPWSWTLVHEDE
jgi:hypothetical protein